MVPIDEFYHRQNKVKMCDVHTVHLCHNDLNLVQGAV